MLFSVIVLYVIFEASHEYVVFLFLLFLFLSVSPVEKLFPDNFYFLFSTS